MKIINKNFLIIGLCFFTSLFSIKREGAKEKKPKPDYLLNKHDDKVNKQEKIEHKKKIKVKRDNSNLPANNIIENQNPPLQIDSANNDSNNHAEKQNVGQEKNYNENDNLSDNSDDQGDNNDICHNCLEKEEIIKKAEKSYQAIFDIYNDLDEKYREEALQKNELQKQYEIEKTKLEKEQRNHDLTKAERQKLFNENVTLIEKFQQYLQIDEQAKKDIEKKQAQNHALSLEINSLQESKKNIEDAYASIAKTLSEEFLKNNQLQKDNNQLQSTVKSLNEKYNDECLYTASLVNENHALQEENKSLAAKVAFMMVEKNNITKDQNQNVLSKEEKQNLLMKIEEKDKKIKAYEECVSSLEKIVEEHKDSLEKIIEEHKEKNKHTANSFLYAAAGALAGAMGIYILIQCLSKKSDNNKNE